MNTKKCTAAVTRQRGGCEGPGVGRVLQVCIRESGITSNKADMWLFKHMPVCTFLTLKDEEAFFDNSALVLST